MRLVVNDGTRDSAPDFVIVSTDNVAPVADAGPDQTVPVGANVRLNASESSDVDGDLLTYAWILRAPDGSTASLSDSTALAPTFVVDEPGTYVAELVVNDGIAQSSPERVSISSAQSAPVARAGADRTVAPGSVVLLDAGLSFDPDGDSLTYEWRLTSRPHGSAAALTGVMSAGASLVVDRRGAYVVQLVVDDGAMSSVPDTMIVSTVNSAPVARAGSDQLGVDVGTAVTLDGSLSDDSDGQPLSYAWSLVARPEGSTASVVLADAASSMITPDVRGDYVVQLIASDGVVDSEPDTVLIRVGGSGAANGAGASATSDVGAADVPIASLLGSWSGTTGQPFPTPPYFKMWVDTPGVIGIDTWVASSGAVPGGACFNAHLIIVNMVPPSPIAGDSFTATFSGSSSSGTIAGTFANGSAASGTIDLSYHGPLLGCNPVHTTWSASHTDPGPVPTVSVVATDSDASEVGPDDGTFTISRSGSTGEDVFVGYSLSGTASSSDYTGISGFSVKIPAGQASVTLTVHPTSDAFVEGSETVVLTLADRVPYLLGTPTSATVTIADVSGPPPSVTVSATDSAASELASDPGTFTFTRSGSTASALTVNFSTTGTAVAGTDYADVGWTSAVIPAGQASVTKTVTPVADALGEAAETVVVTLTAGAYTIGAPSTATVTIADAPAVSVSATDPDASETGPDPGTFTFTRTGSTASALTVNFSTTGTAAAGSDYTNVGWTIVIIPAGQASATKTVTPVADALVEGAETVIVTLSAGSYTIGAPNTATVTIADAPAPSTVTVVATDSAAAELGPDTGTFTFSRSGSTAAPLTVNFATSGSAASGTDYANTGWTTVTIATGQASVTKTVTPVADALVEGSETVTVMLAAGAYTIGAPGTATVTIADAPAGQPNLQVSKLAGKAAAGAGLPYDATDTIANNGVAAASASATRFFLSANNVWDGGDTILEPTAGRPVPPLVSGGTNAGKTTLTIPIGTALGKWFLIAVADASASVAESNESDNTRSKTIYVGPDLQVSTLTAPSTAAAGAAISVTETTTNKGGAPVTATTTTRVYLSRDKKLQVTDVALGAGRSVGPLAVNAKSVATSNLTIPAGTAPGTYYLLANSDDGNVQAEGRETNNIRVLAIVVN